MEYRTDILRLGGSGRQCVSLVVLFIKGDGFDDSGRERFAKALKHRIGTLPRPFVVEAGGIDLKLVLG